MSSPVSRCQVAATSPNSGAPSPRRRVAPRSYMMTRCVSGPIASTITLPFGTPSSEMRGRSRQPDVGEPHVDALAGTGEVDAGQLADRAPGAVAAGQVPGAQPPRAVRRGEFDGDAVRVLAESGQLGAAAYLGAQFRGPLGQHGLGEQLRFPARAERAGVQHAVVELESAEVADRYRVHLTESVEQAALAELLDGAGRESERAG